MRKSLWSPDEDEKLRHYIVTHGCGNWSDVAKHTGLHRCGKSCRLRWINYLRPDLKSGPFSAQEVRLVVNLHNSMGNSWSKIATHLPGRTDNDVKNFWHSYTRSRRMQQQQHANNISRQSSEASIKSNDNYHSADVHASSRNYEDLRQLQSPNINLKGGAPAYIADACKSVHNTPQMYLNACKPHDLYASLNLLPHTNLSSISFDEPNPIAAHTNNMSNTNHITNPLFNLNTKPASISNIQPPSHIEEAALSALYKGFLPQNFNNQSCSTSSSISFQHFPNSKEVSDHSDLLNSLPGGHLNDIQCTAKLKTAVNTSNAVRISQLIPHQRYHNPLDYPAASYHTRNCLPAFHNAIEDGATDFKPPEGLQSVIWSFLKGQPKGIDAAGASDIDDYNEAQYAASNHYHYQNHVIKPHLAFPEYLSSDYPPHQHVPSDQYINVEAFSYTSPSNIPNLQAQYLADCLS